MRQPWIIPGQHRFAVALPLAAVVPQAEAPLADVGTGLLEPQCEASEILHGDGLGGVAVVGRLAAAIRSAFQQERGGVLWDEHLHLLELKCRAPVAHASSDYHLAAAELRQQGFHLRRSLRCVDVVEDQQPAGIRLQPVERCLPLGCFFCVLFVWQIQRLDFAQRGQVAVQRLRTAGANQKHRIAATDLPPGVLDRQAGFAHTTGADQNQGPVCGLQRFHEGAAALEQRADAREGQGQRPAGEAGCHQKIQHK